MKTITDIEVYEKLEGLSVPEEKQDAIVKVFQSWPRGKSEFLSDNRDHAVALANEMFVVTGVERNISKAFKLFLDYFADEEYPLKITGKDIQYVTKKMIPDRLRPRCPDCGSLLFLWHVNTSSRTMVGGDFKTQWICKNEIGCGYQGEYSILDAAEWRKKLEKEN